MCFVRASFSGESPITPESSSGDYEGESWIGISMFSFRMFNYLKEIKEGTMLDLVSVVPSFFVVDFDR